MSFPAPAITPGPEVAPSPAPPVLLLGLGNDILTDDAIGLHVVHALQQELAGHPSLDIRETTEMGLALLDYITGYSAVVIVDSIQTGKAPPGFLHELDAAALTRLTGRTPHFVGISETLALGRHLGLAMPQQVTIFAIEVEDPFTLGAALTPALQAALPGIVARIRAALQPLL
ncbi:MAG: hydrogenase maturation protease [Verrucomicrobiota bacterium]|jgi:hydrogenase maturation protease